MEATHAPHYLVLARRGLKYVTLLTVIPPTLSSTLRNPTGATLLSDRLSSSSAASSSSIKTLCSTLGEVKRLVKGAGIVFAMEDKRPLFEADRCLRGALPRVAMLYIDGCVPLSAVNCGGRIFVFALACNWGVQKQGRVRIMRD